MKHEVNECLSMREALDYCAVKGHPITHQGLIYIGKMHGFIFKDADDHHWLVDYEELKHYVNKATEIVPQDMLTVKEAASIVNRSVPWVYVHIRSGELETKRYGAGEGITYVKRSDVERINDKYSGHHKQSEAAQIR